MDKWEYKLLRDHIDKYENYFDNTGIKSMSIIAEGTMKPMVCVDGVVVETYKQFMDVYDSKHPRWIPINREKKLKRIMK